MTVSQREREELERLFKIGMLKALYDAHKISEQQFCQAMNAVGA